MIAKRLLGSIPHRTMSTEPILVVGAGLTGLAIAKTLELSKAQDRIRLFDGTMPDKHPGYSLTLLQSTIDTLESAWNCKGAFSNCGVDASLGNEGQIGQRYVNAQTGQAVDGPGQSGDSRRISRDALDKLLKKDVKVEFDKRVANVEKIATGFKLTMKDDSTVEGFLLLACDGVHSSIRKQLHPDVKPSVSALSLSFWTLLIGPADSALRSLHRPEKDDTRRSQTFLSIYINRPDGSSIIRLHHFCLQHNKFRRR